MSSHDPNNPGGYYNQQPGGYPQWGPGTPPSAYGPGGMPPINPYSSPTSMPGGWGASTPRTITTSLVTVIVSVLFGVISPIACCCMYLGIPLAVLGMILGGVATALGHMGLTAIADGAASVSAGGMART